MLLLDLIIGMLIVSGISMAAVALYARRFIRRVPAAVPYVLLLFCAAAWAVLYALDLLTTDLPLKILYHNLRFLFIPFFPVLELWLVLAFVKKTEWIRKDWAAALLIIPVAAAALAITSPYHSLFRYDFSINMSGPVPVLQYTESAFYALYFAYSFALLLLAVVLLIAETRKQGILWEPQTLLLILALAFPTAVNYTSVLGLTPVPGINIAPVLLWIPGILYTVALFRYQFLDIVPIARGRLIEALSKPVLVLDPEGRIIDMNPAACSLFDASCSSSQSRPVQEIAADWPDFLALCRDGAAQRRELARHRDGLTRYYIGSGEPLLTRHGEIEGHLIFLQDITDLKQAEQALRESEERLQLALSGADLGTWNWDIPTGAVVFNRRWAEMLGYTPEEIEPHLRSWERLVHPDDLPRVRAVLNAHLEGKTPSYECEHRMLHKDGTWIWVLDKGKVTRRDGQGRPLAAAGTHLDITDRIRTEEALREKTEEMDQYFSTSLDLFCIADTAGYFRRLNPEWEKTLGYSLAELEGKRFLDFVHPDDLQATLAAVAELSAQNEVINFLNRYRHKDGTYRWIEWRSFPKGDRIFAAARDITDRKRMEEALRESEEKYRSIIENMQDLFYRTDREGKITMISPSAIHLAGYDTIDQLIGRDVTTVYADITDREKLLSVLKKQGSVYAYPLTLRTRTGTLLHVTTSSHFYRNAEGEVLGVEGVIHDITEQRRAEEALKVALKKLNMLSSITRHDILNQIMGLRTYLEISRQDLRGTPFEQMIEREDQAAEAIQRQIEFTRYYQDIGVNAPKWQEAGTIIDEAAGQLDLRAVDIRNAVTGVEIFADPLIVKVFFNLMENSLRHGERVTQMDFSCRETGAGLIIVYADNGVGISAEDKALLFRKGFGKHSGLGLFLSREILAITGITIAENGEPGRGARFEITVPAGAFRYKP